MIKRLQIRFCDEPGCKVYSTSEDNKVRTTGGDGEWCLEHYPYHRCSVCNKKMRPYQALLEDWPDTVARGSTEPPKCMTHAVIARARKYSETHRFSGHKAYPISPDKAIAVQNHIKKKYPADYDLLTQMLGINDDYSRYEQQ